MAGWIKLHRSFLEWEWYQDINVRLLALHLLLKANNTERKWQGITIGKGQLIASSDGLASEIGITRQQVRTALGKLKNSGFCNQQTTNKYTLLTICNYCNYQDKQECEQPTNNQQITNEQPTNNQQITTTKECKNIRNKEDIDKSENKFSQTPPSCFVEVWESYRWKKLSLQEEFNNLCKKTDPYKINWGKLTTLVKNASKDVYFQSWLNSVMSKILNEKKPKKVNFKAKLIEIGVAEQTANDWMEVRRVKKAVNTITALDRLLKQLRLAYKAGYKPEDCIGIAVEKGWKGFEYKWLENLKNDSNEQPTTTRRADARPTDSERREGYATALNGIINAENSAAIPVL